MLSPKWGDVFGGDSRPAPYEAMFEKKPNGMPKLRKIAVLMTDGEYNTQYLNADSTTQARSICANLKQTGIEVFTVGFQLGGIAIGDRNAQALRDRAEQFLQRRPPVTTCAPPSATSHSRPRRSA